MKYQFLILFTLLLWGCKQNQPEEPIIVEVDEELIEFVSLMTGSFSNSNQATNDSLYRDVTMHLYPIWETRDGHWLYVEQKLSDTLAKPYRQRIYSISRENDSVFKSDIYTFPNGSLWAGKWKTPEVFDKLLFDTLILSNGCEIQFTRNNNTYQGKSNEKSCPSTLHGATYMTTEIEINERNIITREKGFNEIDSLVWGPAEGGYVFERIKE